jgi:outer membrane protein TolC
MRKNISKVIAFAIGISVMSGSITPVFAADNVQNINAATNVQNQSNQKSVLTLDGAIKAAINLSETLELDTKKITYQNTTNDINEDLDDFNGVDGDDEDFKEDTRDITINKLRQQRDFDQDILIQKVTTAYNALITSQMEINKAAKELEIKNKELSNSKLKESLGIKTSTDLKSAELEIENLQNEQKSRENALKDAQYSFKVLTGKDVAEFSLEQDIKYEPFKLEGSIDKYLDGVIDKYLKYSEQLVKLNKDYYYDSDRKITANYVDDAKTVTEKAIEGREPKLSDYTSGDYSTDYDSYKTDYDKYESQLSAYTGAVSARLAYLQSKLSVDENQTGLNENKKQFKSQLRTYYTNLLTQEDTINYIKKNIELSNKQLSDTKLKYDLGMITESDYSTQVLNSQALDLQLRSAIDSYNTIKEKIQKPWIAFSS